MKIGIDARCLMQKKYSGISWYTFNLIQSLAEFDRDNEYVLFYNSSKEIELLKFPGDNFENVVFKYPNKIINQSFSLFNYPQIDKMLGGVDVFFMPNMNFMACSDSCKRVITVHDLSFLRYPQFWTSKSRLWHKILIFKKVLQNADTIIAVSHNTKRDLIELLNVDPEKIKVVYEGVDLKFGIVKNSTELERAKKRYKLPSKFILYLGTLEPRKNIEGIIEAYNKLDTDHSLVIGGGDGWKTSEIEKLSKNNNKIKLIGYVAEEDKRALYNLADLFVYPSYYEGFGLPLLEAMACGTPVIAGANSSQVEVIDNAGLLIDCYNINEIYYAMKTLLGDDALRSKLIERGFKRAEEFNWNDVAMNTLRVFNGVVD